MLKRVQLVWLAVVLALGTGIGCAALCGGRLLQGAQNRAAMVFGHSCVAHNGSAGRCGNPGCAEDLASTARLAELARSRPDFAASGLAHAARIDYECLFSLADNGDTCAVALRRESLNVWAVLVQNSVLAFDPEMVVLGGGVLRRRDVILPAIQAHLERQVAGLRLSVPVVAAALGDDAALIGGETLFRQTHPELHL